MNKENIPVITDREKLYDKCENMEQLFDKYYLPLLDKHYSKTYELQQENTELKDNWNKLKEWLVQLQKFKGINQQGFSWGVAQEVLDKIEEIEGSDVNEI